MKESTKILAFIAWFLIWLLIGFGIGRRWHRDDPEPQVITQVDTCIILDTIVVEKPVFRYSYIYDTVRTYFTTVEHDTVEVEVPIERKVYAEDSLYYASVSGWHPSLDTLVVYPKETTITITNTVKTPAPKFSFGITTGPSVVLLPNGGLKGGLGVTAGLQYRF